MMDRSTTGPSSWSRVPLAFPDARAEQEGQHEKHQEDVENDLGDLCGTGRQSTESEDPSDDRDNEESNYPSKHDRVVFWLVTLRHLSYRTTFHACQLPVSWWNFLKMGNADGGSARWYANFRERK